MFVWLSFHILLPLIRTAVVVLSEHVTRHRYVIYRTGLVVGALTLRTTKHRQVIDKRCQILVRYIRYSTLLRAREFAN